MIMDATSREDLPEGIAANRVPTWMLPHTPAHVLKKYRPDMLLLDGLLSVDAPARLDLPIPPRRLQHIQETCTLHIVEFTYTIESCYADTIAYKREQHVALVQALSQAGWTIHSPQPSESVHILVMGSTGTIFSSTPETLQTLGIPPKDVTTVLQTLHQYAVQYAASILGLRRKLERSTDVFQPAPPIIDDPP